MRRRLLVAAAIVMTNEDAAWRRYARIVLMRSAQESCDQQMAPHVWLREVERDAEPLRCYQGDVAALRRETLAIADLVWGEQVEPR